MSTPLDSQKAKELKVVVVGDGSVGKVSLACARLFVSPVATQQTCLFIAHVHHKFPTDYLPTIYDKYDVNIKVRQRQTRFFLADFLNQVGDEVVSVGFWDTAGREEYDRLRPLSYPGTSVFLLAFSVVNRASFVRSLDKDN
jgi:GTPase SAR1 family protein